MSGDYETEMLLQMYELAGESVFAAPKVAHRVPRAQAMVAKKHLNYEEEVAH